MPDDIADGERLRAHTMAGWDGAMKFRYLRASGDEVVVEYDVEAIHKQPYGIVHGGVHCGVIEAVCSAGAGMHAMARGRASSGSRTTRRSCAPCGADASP
jgi:acyl-coenzyme A thioesterase PaaI-like protein